VREQPELLLTERDRSVGGFTGLSSASAGPCAKIMLRGGAASAWRLREAPLRGRKEPGAQGRNGRRWRPAPSVASLGARSDGGLCDADLARSSLRDCGYEAKADASSSFSGGGLRQFALAVRTLEDAPGFAEVPSELSKLDLPAQV